MMNQRARRSHRTLVRRSACGLLTGFALAAACAACDDLIVDPAPRASAALAITWSLAPSAGAMAGGAGEAFDSANRVQVRLARSGEVMVDTLLPFASAGAETRLRLAVDREAAGQPMQLDVELRLGNAPLFRGSTQVTLETGSTTRAALTLLPVPAGVRLPESVPTLTSIGDTVQLAGAVIFATGDTVPGRAISWSTLDPDVAAVDVRGRLIARAEGSARIVGSHEAFADTLAVTIRAVVASVTVDPAAATIFVQATRQFTATARDRRGNTLDRSFTWTSANPGVATVDAATGLVTGMAPGTTTITAASDGIAGSATVTVRPVPVASVSISPAAGTVILGRSRQLEVTIRDAQGNVLSGRALAWRSADASVVTVDQNGVVTGVREGTATITATSEGVTGTATITVVAAPTATTLGASAISATGATLNGRVNPNGQPTTAFFEWGTSPTLVNAAQTSPQSVGSSSADQPITGVLSGLAPGVTYFFRIVASSSAGIARGAIDSFTTLQPPASPTALTAQATFGQFQNIVVDLGWSDNSNTETEFRIERRLGSVGAWTQIGSTAPNQVSFTDTGVVANQTYSYRVRACSDNTCSSFSNEATVSTTIIN